MAGLGTPRSIVSARHGTGSRIHPDLEHEIGHANSAENFLGCSEGEWRLMESISQTPPRPELGGDFPVWAMRAVLRPMQLLMAAPSLLFLAALTAMLLRHPDVAFYEIDRVAFGFLLSRGGGSGDGPAATAARGGAGHVADDRPDRAGAWQCSSTTVRSRDLEPAGLEVHCSFRAFSFGGAGVHGGKEVSAV